MFACSFTNYTPAVHFCNAQGFGSLGSLFAGLRHPNPKVSQYLLQKVSSQQGSHDSTSPGPRRDHPGDPTGPLSRHLATFAASVVNTNLYNKQYNEDLKEFVMKTINSFEWSLYCLLYKLVFTTLSARVARWRDNGVAGPRLAPGVQLQRGWGEFTRGTDLSSRPALQSGLGL